MKIEFNKEIANRIRAIFGLNEYETKVWLALLFKGVSTIGEIYELSGVPRSRVYDVLESLERKGFVIMKIGKPLKYMAIHPEDVIEKIKLNLINEAKEKIKIFDNIKNTEEYKYLNNLFDKQIKTVNVEDAISIIKGKFNINSLLRSTIQNAKKNIIIVTNADNIHNEAKIIKPFINKLEKEKVNLILAANCNDYLAKKISADLGIKIRKIDIDARLIVIDDNVFIINKENETKNEYAINIKSNFFSSSIKNLLNSYLNKK
ncbi:MAG: helix-turn-helix domain-containing protein [Candidatus Pacearchaeota archaeon]